MTTGARWRLVTAAALLAGVAMVLASVRPELFALTHRGALVPVAVSTAQIPVPQAARHCVSQPTAEPGSTRWCLPADVGAPAVSSWYGDVLPAGRSHPPLTWCMTQVQADGSRRSLWADGDALVGYQLPPTQARPTGPAPNVIETFRLLHRSCPRVARPVR